MSEAKTAIKEDTRFVIPKNIRIKNTETRWGRPVSDEPMLHDGKYIVEYLRNGEAHLQDADWKGEDVTYRSSKHGHLVDVDDLARAVETGRVKALGD